MKSGTIISLLILGLLIGATFLIWKQPWQVKKTGPYFSGEINKFCVNSSCLDKSSGLWMVNGAPADQDAANNTVDKLVKIELGDIISTNKDRFGQLGFVDTNKVIVEVNNKKLELGSANASYDGAYIKEPNVDIVYNTNVYLEKNNLVSESYWMNKNVTNFPILQIKKVTVDNKEVTDKKMIEKLANLKVVKYLSDNKDPVATRVFEIQTDNSPSVLKIGQKNLDWKNKLFWATVDDKFYYEIDGADFSLLTAWIK